MERGIVCGIGMIFCETYTKEEITAPILLERFEKEGSMEYFDERDAIGLLLDLARCPGDREWITELLLQEFGSLKGVLEAREEQLRKVDGVGRRTAVTIRTVIPLVRLWERTNMEEADRIGNSREAERYCKSLLEGLRNERFYAICLNAQCKILGQRKISEGSLSEVHAYPRIVMETALNYNAHSVLLCHNHPGGTNLPSCEDILSTKLLQKMLHNVGILVLDHIIVSGQEAYSMVQHGDIDYKP